jgi:tetratricopeptide (TPR) repeat protein
MLAYPPLTENIMEKSDANDLKPHSSLYSDREVIVSPLRLGRDPSKASSSKRSRRHSRRHGKGRRWGMILVGLVFFVYVVVTLVIIGRKGLERIRPSVGTPAAVPPPPSSSSAVPTIPRLAPPPAAPSVGGAQEAFTALKRQDEMTRDELDVISAMIARGLTTEALKRLQQLRVKAPGHIAMQFTLADLFMQVKQYDEAQELLLDILRRLPDHLEARRRLAFLWFARADYAAAAEACEWVLAITPRDWDIMARLATSYAKTGRYEQSAAYWKQMLDAGQEVALSRRNLAMAYLHLDRPGKAVSLLNQAIAENPRDGEAYEYLALCHARQQRVEDTVDVLSRAAENIGAHAVHGWTQREDFNSLRASPVFAEFVQRLNNPNAAAAALSTRATAPEETRAELVRPGLGNIIGPGGANPLQMNKK